LSKLTVVVRRERKGLSRSRCEGAMGMDEKGSGAGAVIGNAYTKVETILRCCRGRG
jgi:hypothetical protein